MIRTVLIFPLLILLTSCSQKQSERKCADLVGEQVRYVKKQIKSHSGPISGGPIKELFQEIYKNLDQKYIDRINPDFILEFASICKSGSPHTGGSAIKEAAKNLGLKLTRNTWGLAEIPVIDIEKATCRELMRMAKKFPEKSISTKFNDPLEIMFRNYWSEYNITSSINLINPAYVRKVFMKECRSMPNQKIVKTLKIISKTEGLHKNNQTNP